jgi:hypothetical protein
MSPAMGDGMLAPAVLIFIVLIFIGLFSTPAPAVVATGAPADA